MFVCLSVGSFICSLVRSAFASWGLTSDSMSYVPCVYELIDVWYCQLFEHGCSLATNRYLRYSQIVNLFTHQYCTVVASCRQYSIIHYVWYIWYMLLFHLCWLQGFWMTFLTIKKKHLRNYRQGIVMGRGSLLVCLLVRMAGKRLQLSSRNFQSRLKWLNNHA